MQLTLMRRPSDMHQTSLIHNAAQQPALCLRNRPVSKQSADPGSEDSETKQTCSRPASEMEAAGLCTDGGVEFGLHPAKAGCWQSC